VGRLILILVILFSALNCGPAGSDPGAEEAKSSKQKDGTSESSDRHVSVVNEIERIKKNADTAFASRDWIETKQLIAKGLNLTGENNADLELQRAELLLRLGDVERETGREIEARRQYSDATAVFHVHKNAEGGFKACLSIGQLEVLKGDYSAAARQFAEAEALIPQLKNNTLIGALKVHKGRLASRQVKPEEARNEFLEAIKIFETERDKKNTAETLLLLASEEDALGWMGALKNHLDRATAIFRDLGDMDGEARALHRLAGLAERDKKYNRAKQLLQKVEELYEKLDRTTAATNVGRHINSLPDDE
jgi:tetratricopeptide (TPR) repeat protein